MTGIGCPKCASPQLTVLDSRRSDDGVRRRRKCHKCGHRFSTIETTVPEKPRAKYEDAKVDNPYFAADHPVSDSNPVKVGARINVHESAIATMYARGALNMAQKMAADRVRAKWEACGGRGGSAMDYSKDVVDGGLGAQDISIAKLEAAKEIARCRKLLKLRDFILVIKVCGEGLSLSELADTQRARNTAADNLRASLDDLAEMWNLRMKRRAG